MTGTQADYLHAVVKYFGRDKVCPVCRKHFLGDSDLWVYKRLKSGGKYAYFCSWTCVRQWDAGHQPKKGRKRTPHEHEIYRRLEAGERPYQIARELGITKGTVWYYYDRWNEAKEDSE